MLALEFLQSLRSVGIYCHMLPPDHKLCNSNYTVQCVQSLSGMCQKSKIRQSLCLFAARIIIL